MVYDFLLKISVFGLIILGVIYTFKTADYNGVKISFLTWFIPYLYCLYSVKKSIFNKYIFIISFAYLCVYFTMSYTTVAGFRSGKAYWLIVPTLLTIVMILNEPYEKSGLYGTMENIRKVAIDTCILCSVVLLSLFRIWSVYNYIYRDDEISLLTNKLGDGIWKGLYTTELRSNNVIDVEEYLKTITNDCDDILCLDWVSFGYLMTNGQICSPTTLDASHYTYGINTPNPYYMYFSVMDKVPTKIIYINYGRDEIISIDDPEWAFNEFVGSYYKYNDSYSNEIFSVREYVVTNYDGALDKAKREADFD